MSGTVQTDEAAWKRRWAAKTDPHRTHVARL